MGPMTTGPLNPANGWESTGQVLFCIRGDSLLCRVKLLKKKGKDCHPKKNVSTLVISVLTTPGSISWINTPVPSISKARDCKISSMNENKRMKRRVCTQKDGWKEEEDFCHLSEWVHVVLGGDVLGQVGSGIKTSHRGNVDHCTLALGHHGGQKLGESRVYLRAIYLKINIQPTWWQR